MIAQRLLRRSGLLPGESLPSLINRLAERNGYHIANVLWRLCQCGSNDRIGRPTKADTFNQIAVLTGIGQSALWHSSIHSFAQVLVPPGNRVDCLQLGEGGGLPILPASIGAPHVRTAATVYFCPDCLTEGSYHRLIWVPGAVSVCLRHKRLLVSCCPECRKPIAMLGLVRATCLCCEADLRNAPSGEIGQDTLGLLAQRTIQAWFSGSRYPVHGEVGPLASQPLASLYRVLYGLAQSILHVDPDWDYRHRLAEHMPMAPVAGSKATLSPTQSYLLYTTAFKALVDWPEQFWSFLDALKARPGKRSPGLNSEFGTVYSRWLQRWWLHPSQEFVQQAFREYLAKNYVASSLARSHRRIVNPAMVDDFLCVSGAEAAKLLGSTVKVINRLVKLGVLRPKLMERAPTRQLFLRQDVLALRLSWQDSFSAHDAAYRLGLSKEVVLGLAKAGILKANHGPTVDGWQRWMIDRSSLIGFQDTLNKHQIRGHMDCDEVSVETAARILAPIGYGAVEIVQEIVNGNLHLLHHVGLPRSQVVLSRTELSQFRASWKGQRNWISRADAAKILSVKPNIVSRWVRQGLLTPAAVIARVQHFERYVIDRFAMEHVSSREASRLLGVTPLTIQKWARIGRLVPVSGPAIDGCHSYLFRRADLVELQFRKGLNQCDDGLR